VTGYAGLTVLVTGADGFIGSHLVERLVRDGASVRAFCLYNPQGSRGWLDIAPDDIRKQIDFRLGDIRDPRLVSEAVRGTDVVMHLAALIAIPYSYTAPESFVQVNVGGTLNVLEACRGHGVRKVIQTSTSEVYGTPDSLPIREDHPIRAQSPYAATKVAADQLALSYQRSFEVPVTVLRPFNTYGPRQSARAVLPAILTQLLDGRTELLLGRTDTRRDLTFVDDTVDGFARAGLADGIVGDTIQLGTGRDVSIAELVEIAGRVLGVEATIQTDPRRLRPDPSEVLVLRSSPERALATLGWQPTFTIEDGVSRTADWLRVHLDRYRPDELHV
jgi:UDP-glucose 4-epimerase